MNRMRLNLLAATAIALACATHATAVRADCVDGVRDATQAELDFAARARAALVAGLPPLPSPIERRGRPIDFNERVNLSFCRGQPVGSFDVSIADGYLYNFTPTEANDRSQRRRELQRQIEQLQQLPPDKEAQRKALADQARAAYDAAPRRSRKDPPLSPEQQALADKQGAEGRRLEDAARRVTSDHQASVKAQTDPLRVQADELQQGPQIFQVDLAINRASFSEAGKSALITFGAPSAKRSTGLIVHNVVVTVVGPDGPARRALVEAIDRPYLQGLVGKAPPQVAASQTRVTAVAAAAPPPAVQPAVAAAAGAVVTAGAAARPAAQPTQAATAGTAPTPAPTAREEQKKAEPVPTVQDAANAVNKLRGLLGR